MNTEGITLVTVAFEAETMLLALQARSVARYLSPADIHQILIIDNSAKGLRTHYREKVMRAYGPHAAHVSWLRPSEIMPIPPASGWYLQQLLKLVIADQVLTPAYVALDAKDHFVGPADPTVFVGPNDRGRVPAYSYREHPLRPHLERTLGYLGVPPDLLLDHFAATVTPFTFETREVRALMHDVGGRRTPPDFAAEFIENQLLEFFLYSAWLIQQRGSLEEAFDVQLERFPKVWRHNATASGIDDAVDTARRTAAPVFSVHRRALAMLSPAALHRLARFWVERGLFPNELQAFLAVTSLRLKYLLHEVNRRLRRALGSRSDAANA